MEKFGLDRETAIAHRDLRYDGQVVPRHTLNKKIYESGARYQNGFFLKRRDDPNVICVTSTTICDGARVVNFKCKIDNNGNLLTGRVNTFAFGTMEMDQGYMDELYEENKNNPIAWDFVQLNK